MILFIDNYDSFTYNLVDYLGQLEPDLAVYRNDKIDLAGIARLRPAGIVLSPGPGRPENAGICCDAIRRFGETTPILGVCLGHQCIGSVFGAAVVRAPAPVHGKTNAVSHFGHALFDGIPSPFPAARYHSLLVERAGVSGDLAVAAENEEGLVMAMSHKRYPLAGVQFHPESILTDSGFRMLENWLALTRKQP